MSKPSKKSPIMQILSIFNIFMYITLGAYYVLNFLLIKPLNFIGDLFKNIYYHLFTTKSVKKEKDLTLTMNFEDMDDSESVKSKDKSIYAQMQANKKMLKGKKEKKLDEKQKQKLDAEREELLKKINDGAETRYEKPQTFLYKAMSPEGKVEKGTFIGVSKLDIYTFLTGEGYTVFSIETSDWINFLYGQSDVIGYKISNRDLIFFITQLSTYIKAGITLTESMRIISKQLNNNKRQQRVMQSIVYYLTMGESFSSALEHQKNTFPQLLINMVKAAEATGALDETLDDLGNYYTEINDTKKEMISAISYPAIVAVFSVGVIIFIMLSIVPRFIDIYETAGAKLNPLTIFVINSSNFLTKYILVIILIVVGIVILILYAYKNIKSFRRSLQTFLMKMPVIGKIIIYNELTIFTKTFASLLKNDVFITDSINILSKLTNNEIYKEIMVNTITNIVKGEKISESFKDHWAIPDIAYYMIVTGETTGQLAAMMKKVSDYYQGQHKAMVNSLKTLIEPVLIIFLAVVVGGVMIAVIIPMFSLYEAIA